MLYIMSLYSHPYPLRMTGGGLRDGENEAPLVNRKQSISLPAPHHVSIQLHAIYRVLVYVLFNNMM